MKYKTFKKYVSILVVFAILLLYMPVKTYNTYATVTGKTNEQKIYDFFTKEMGVNMATACGILANIQKESNFNTTSSVVDTNNLTSYGICQWNGGRFTALQNYCSGNGYSYQSIEGQLNYLKYELKNSERSAWSRMQGLPNTADGAYQAGYNWARYFERCSSVYYESRAVLAKNTYWPSYCGTTAFEFSADLKSITDVGVDDATVSGYINTNQKVSSGMTVGMYLGTSESNMKKINTENVSSSAYNNTGAGGFNIWYDIKTELGVTLSSNTKYYCKFYVTYNGVEKTSSIGTFTTLPSPDDTFSVKLSVDKNNVVMSDNVKLTASVENGNGAYTYSYLVHNIDNNTWYRFGDFSGSNTYNWYASGTGNREFFVEAKSSTGKIKRSTAVNVVVKDSLSIGISVDSNNILKGSNINLTAVGAGGTGNYTYSFIVYNEKTGGWYRFSDFKENNSLMWNASTAENRTFYAEVKDSSGNIVRSKPVTVIIKEPEKLQVVLVSSTGNVNVGGKETFIAKATGGSGDYSYSYLVHNKDNDSWYRFNSFQKKDTLEWIAGSAGNREFYVEAKDSQGNVVRSSALNILVK